ncbi:MAG TPA: Gfo/Idh/MocA family oxidoreductase [Planctomycetota bacterium]|jgi:predicted dehydrogenase
MKKAVLALIGAGNLANAQHLPNLAYCPHARLKTVCDTRPEAVQAAQKKYGIPNGETDFRKVLADDEVQGVLVITKEAQHADLTIAALKAGKHVYVEKPLAKTVAECEAVVKAQKKSRRHVAVGFNRRFAPAYRQAKALLDKNGGARVLYYRISDTYSWTWGKNLPPGVRVYHELCHVFDILRYFTESEVASVYCVDGRPDDEIVTMKFRGGQVATILSSGNSTLDWPKESLEIIAERGGLTVDNFVEMWTYGLKGAEKRYRFRGHVHPDREWTQAFLYESLGSEALRFLHALMPMKWDLQNGKDAGLTDSSADRRLREFLQNRMCGGNYDVDKGWVKSVDHFAESIASGKKPENAGAYDGLMSEILADSVVKSRKTGKPVLMK